MRFRFNFSFFSLRLQSVWWIRVRALAWKELLQLLRDPILLFIVVYAFSADIYNAASGISLQLNQAVLALLDFDRSAASRELASRFMPPEFRLVGPVRDSRQALDLLDSGQARAVLDLPPGFGAALAKGEPTAVQLQIDASHSVHGFLASVDVAQILARFSLEQASKNLALNAAGRAETPTIDNQTRVWFNPNQNDAWFMGIAELMNVITLFAMLLPAAAMVREKERGTIEQLLVSPLTPLQIMIPKILAMLAVIMIGTALALFGILIPFFSVPIKGDAWLFFAITMLYVCSLACIGLLIATLTRNMAQAGTSVLLIFVPMIFLSGVWTPPEAMPTFLRWGMNLLPLYYYLNCSYGILLKGVGVTVLWPMILGIVMIGITTGTICTLRFKKQFG